jgi:hypothetical protein
MRIWASTDSFALLALLVGLYGGGLGWRPAAWILLGALTLRIGSHLVIGTIAYRRTMRREWPAVEPVPFDDD